MQSIFDFKLSHQEYVTLPVKNNVIGVVAVPGSKSISNRVLLIAALAKGKSKITNMLYSVDTQVMMEALSKLGVVFTQAADKLIVTGKNGRLGATTDTIYVENSGTSARFLTASLTLGTGSYILTGNDRMQNRPLADLLNALSNSGSQVSALKNNGCPPLKIEANGLMGGKITIKADNSSQYVSALMLAAPYALNSMEITLAGDLVSKSYVEMTQRVMQSFGAETNITDNNKIFISNQKKYQATDFKIEADLSSASYFFALAAISGGQVLVENVFKGSLQGDIKFLDLLAKMGCKIEWQKTGVMVSGPSQLLALGTVDMNDISDVAPTLAVTAVFASGVTKIVNVANMRIKECDRIQAVFNELKKIGVFVEQFEDGLLIKGIAASHIKSLKPATLETYDDHRMAMSFSLLGTKIAGIKIINPNCVSKTFPNYFTQLFRLLA